MHYQPKHPLPKIKKIQTTWDLKKHFYTSAKDPQLAMDIAEIETAYTAFAKKYQKKSFINSPGTLAKALADYAKLLELPSSKPILYFWYRKTLNSSDAEAERHINQLVDRFTKMENEVLFFTLAIGTIPKKKQKAFLIDQKLASYRYLLQTIFTNACYQLSEAEERILNLKSAPARGLWVSGTEKILNQRTITYKNQSLPLMEALETVSAIAPIERPILWQVITTALKQDADIVENELNAIIIDKKINDELRGFTTPYESNVLANENTVPSVEALVHAISTEGFALSKKFYKLKAKLHGQSSIPYAARYDPIGTDPIIPFAQAVEICRDVFYGIKNEYGSFFDTMLTAGQIDVYPKARRSGGAFMSSAVKTPVMVFLNHTNNFKTLETLAHEMGHALHSSRSKAGQPVWYEDYSTTTAETASTLFENLVFDAVYQQADTATKQTLLHDRITRDISTIQRQIAFFNYECAIHSHVRTHGAITKEELAKLFVVQLKAHLGSAVSITPDDGYSYVYVGHFRSMFYVYTYAYGLLMSNLMAKQYLADPSYINQIDTFLSAGGSDTVDNIFASIGINTTKIDTFTSSLSALSEQIKEFARITK